MDKRTIEKIEGDLFEYKNSLYPEYIKHGNAAQYIFPIAKKFCKGDGLDIGGLEDCHFPGVEYINKIYGGNAFNIPIKCYGWDFIFSSHCLEHLENYIKALEHWSDRLKYKGRLFLYLPHPDMEYWRPENCRKHLHVFWPYDLARVLETLNFKNIIYSERDLNWSFAITGVKK
jgi:SAM-dependent methyltransferase